MMRYILAALMLCIANTAFAIEKTYFDALTDKIAQPVYVHPVTPFHQTLTITAVTATSRVQLSSAATTACSFFVESGGTIYLGDATVTNSSGLSPGFPLTVNSYLSNFSLADSSDIYIAADTNPTVVRVLCN